MSVIITLTTDFGIHDSYVASMKGAILSINPDASIVDICHTIRPQDIQQVAFILGTSCYDFPLGTIHLAVVDPGVGSDRRAVAVKTPQAYFVAPDNGVLTYAIRQALEDVHLVTQGVDSISATQMDIGEGIEAAAVTNSRYWRHPVSPTFHGRDVLGPVAAHLSLGMPIQRFGEQVDTLCAFPLPIPHSMPNGTLFSSIAHIDCFGNLITGIKEKDLPKGDITIQIGKHTIKGVSRFYAERQGLLAVIGSSGYLEVAVQGGNAQRRLNAKLGDEIRVQSTHPSKDNQRSASPAKGQP